MSLSKMPVHFTCEMCGRSNVRVDVRFRRDESESITDYLEKVIIAAIARKHREISPDCPCREISKLYIPAPNDAQYIGDRNATYSEQFDPPV